MELQSFLLLAAVTSRHQSESLDAEIDLAPSDLAPSTLAPSDLAPSDLAPLLLADVELDSRALVLDFGDPA